jgi:hypothetical protein
MKTTFICLANSRKYGERCIAGIEVKQKGDFWEIVHRNDRPKWLRPVTDTEFGGVSPALVGRIVLLNLVEIDITQVIPKGYQSENVLFDPASLNVLGSITATWNNLSKLANANDFSIFAGHRWSIHKDKMAGVTYSLALIEVHDVRIRIRDDNGHIRAQFRHGQYHYDLPVTDVNFIEKFALDEGVLTEAEHIFFSVSLGIEYQEQYYKLVAGVVWF